MKSFTKLSAMFSFVSWLPICCSKKPANMPERNVETWLHTDQSGEPGFLKNVETSLLELVTSSDANEEQHEHAENLVADFGDVEVLLRIRHFVF